MSQPTVPKSQLTKPLLLNSFHPVLSIYKPEALTASGTVSLVTNETISNGSGTNVLTIGLPPCQGFVKTILSQTGITTVGPLSSAVKIYTSAAPVGLNLPAVGTLINTVVIATAAGVRLIGSGNAWFVYEVIGVTAVTYT